MQKNPKAAQKQDGKIGESWRALLSRHARTVFSNSQGGGKGEQALQQKLSAKLGPLADEALQIVEAFAIGARSQAGFDAESAGGDKLPTEFEARLSIILNGLAPDIESHQRSEVAAPQIIQSELWQLLTKVRESAELSYAREIDLVELDRRILLLLRGIGPLVPADISNAVGVDKAQVSRSVKRLLEIKMVERQQIRSPVCLTRKGKTLSDRLLRLAELRNRELTFDIPDDELSDFRQVVERLLMRAVSLYEQESSRTNDDARSVNRFPASPEDEPGKPIVLDRTRIISPLMTLSAYFSRSGALVFKRLTGLSNFESWVLNEIGRDEPIEWNVLVDRLDRDHSQAGRTVRALVECGLVERQGKPGRRHGRFTLTDEGKRIYAIIVDASRQRSTFLMAPLTKQERERFLSTFDKVRRNAVVQLERERTFDELDQKA